MLIPPNELVMLKSLLSPQDYEACRTYNAQYAGYMVILVVIFLGLIIGNGWAGFWMATIGWLFAFRHFKPTLPPDVSQRIHAAIATYVPDASVQP